MSKPYYANGLRFGCTRCSLCCRFESGYVFLSRADVRRLATRFGISDWEFVNTYCRIVDLGPVKRVSLREQSNMDCIFWRNGECSVYEDRPLQCQMFPFWPAHIESAEQWQEAQESCPGVGLGRLHPREEIDAMLAQREKEPLLDADEL